MGMRGSVSCGLLLLFLTASAIPTPPALFLADALPRHRAIVDKAESLARKGDFAAALASLSGYVQENEMRISSPEKPHFLAARALLKWNIGKPPEALALYREAALSAAVDSSLKDVCDRAASVISLYNEAKNARDLGDDEEAVSLFRKAIEASRALGRPEFEVKSLRQLSLVHWRRQELGAFHALNKEALELAEALNFFRDQSVCLNNIGLYHSRMDNFAQARRHYEDALALAEKTGFLQSQSDVLTNLGVLFQAFGDDDKALAHFLRALEVDRAAGTEALILIDYNNIGTAYRKKGQAQESRAHFESALAYFEKSLDLMGGGGDPGSRIRVLNNIATVRSDLGDYPAALDYYRRSLELAESRGDLEGRSAVLNNMGIVHGLMGNDAESAGLFAQAIELSKGTTNSRILWEAFLERGNAFRKQGDFARARDNYRNSIAIIERARASIDSEEMKALYLGTDKRLEAYHNIFDVLVGTGLEEGGARPAEAFDFYERSKARAFLESLEDSKIPLVPPSDPALAEEEGRISRAVSGALRELFNLPPGSPEREEIERRLVRLEEDHERLKARLRSADPGYAELLYPKIISLAEVQRSLLDGRTAVLAYFVGRLSSYGMAVTRRGLRVFPLPPRPLLQAKVADYLAEIADKDGRAFALGRDLHRDLVEPASVSGCGRLLVVPDDILHYLPFETLRPEGGGWLAAQATLSYAPSLSSLWSIRSRNGLRGRKGRLDILAAGDPSGAPGPGLKHAGAEIAKIRPLFKPGKSLILQGEGASEENVKKEDLGRYKVLHFAVHGIVDDRKPGRSALLLSPGPSGSEDGLLQMGEILGLDLKADLAVLSSCESGLGRFVRGEGIVGLSRAFFHAGASAVLMSLWPVHDQATSQLMERFYHGLRAGRSIEAALREAKAEMAGSEEYGHPYYWAPFIASGHGGNVVFERGAIWPSAVLAALAAGFILGAMRRGRARRK